MKALWAGALMLLLGLLAGEDLLRRRLSLPLLLAAGVLGLLRLWLCLRGSEAGLTLYCRGYLPGTAVGAFLFLLNRLTRGGIGSGDALLYFLLHLWLEAAELLTLTLLSFTACGTVGAVLLLFKQEKRGRLPLVPFTAAAYFLLALCG